MDASARRNNCTPRTLPQNTVGYGEQDSKYGRGVAKRSDGRITKKQGSVYTEPCLELSDKVIDQPHDRTRKHAEHDNRPGHHKHFCGKPIDIALGFELQRGRSHAVGKPRNGHNGARARVFADAIVHAQPGEQRAAKDQNDRNGTGQNVPFQPGPELQHISQKLTETANAAPHHKGAVTRLKMFGRRRKTFYVL